MITFEEIKRKCELLRDETHNRSISATRLGTILLELIREVADADEQIREYVREYCSKYEEVYYYEEDWDKMSESEQQVLIQNTNRLVVLEGAASDTPEPTTGSVISEDGALSLNGVIDSNGRLRLKAVIYEDGTLKL